MWKIQSDTPNEWYNAEAWQITMIDKAIKTKKDYYAKHIHMHKEYTYVCTYEQLGKITLWNLTTGMIRNVINSALGKPYHNGPIKGGGMSIDHLEMANQFQLPLL